MNTSRPLRVLVAGTGFGRIYLQALAAGDPAFRLAGILARGSEVSRELATQYDVPLYTDPAQVPDDIDIACIVVRSGATGGQGSELATRFLHRGIHVLQEHPVHPNEIAACLQAARQGGAVYAVDTLHPYLTPVRRFLGAADALRARQSLHFIDVACNSQMLYPLLDIAGRAVGGLRPWSFAIAAQADATPPFTTVTGHLHGVALTLRVQNQVHPDDPDNHSLLLGQVSVGSDGGVLALPELHGPVLWHARLHAPRSADGRLTMQGPGTERLAVPSTSILGPVPNDDWHTAFARTWPHAVLVALHEVRRAIVDEARRKPAAQWALTVAQAWNDLSQRLGMPRLIRPPEPAAVPLEALLAAASIDLPEYSH